MGQRKKAAFIRKGAQHFREMRERRTEGEEAGEGEAEGSGRSALALPPQAGGAEAGPERAGARQPPTVRGSSPHLQNLQGGKLNSSMKAQIHLLNELIAANY